MRSGFLLLCCLWLPRSLPAQKSYGVQHDFYPNQTAANSFVPTVYYQANKGWYGQVRYNYDEDQTVSVFAGKTFGAERQWTWMLRPQLGLLAGRFTGVGATVEAAIDRGLFSLSTRPQYSVSFRQEAPFFYNWTEASLQPFSFLYAGAALQHTYTRGEQPLLEPGLLLGFTFKNFDVPLYFFSPGERTGYTVIGFCWVLEKSKP